MTPKTTKNSPPSTQGVKAQSGVGLRVPLPDFGLNENAFEYQKTLVNAGFSNVKWEVGPGGPSPNESLTDYTIVNTDPEPGTMMDPSGIVQVIIFLPPDEGVSK